MNFNLENLNLQHKFICLLFESFFIMKMSELGKLENKQKMATQFPKIQEKEST